MKCLPSTTFILPHSQSQESRIIPRHFRGQVALRPIGTRMERNRPPSKLLSASRALVTSGVAAKFPTSVMNRSRKFGNIGVTVSALTVRAWS